MRGRKSEEDGASKDFLNKKRITNETLKKGVTDMPMYKIIIKK